MAIPDPATVDTAPDLFHGGLLYRMLRRHGVDPLDARVTARRAIKFGAGAWLVVALLSLVDRTFLSAGDRLAFLGDVAAHVRMLVAIPLLIAAQPMVGRAWRRVGQLLVERGRVPPEVLPRYRVVVARALGLHDHPLPEIVCLALAVGVAVLGYRSAAELQHPVWYLENGSSPRPSLAGGAYLFVVVSLLFLELRWLWRLAVWHLFLVRTLRLDLRLSPTHPDRAAGLGFVLRPTVSYGPVAFAITASLAGMVANQMRLHDAKLPEFAVFGGVYAGVMLLLFLAPPVAILAPLLARTRRLSLEDWGEFAANEGEAFRRRWSEPGAGTRSEERPSLEEIQVAVSGVQAIRPFPFLLSDILGFLVPLLLPALPLALLAFPLGELLKRVLNLLL